MANLNAPFGLRPVGQVNGQPYSGSVRQYSVPSGDSTAIMLGDPVTLAGTSQIINGQVFSDIKRAATGDILLGAAIAVLPETASSTIYRAASTQRVVFVADDPNALFEAQQVAGGTPMTANDVGLNVNFIVAAGSTFTGLSGVALNNGSEAVTNTLDLKIVGMVNRADNDPGSAVGTGADASRFLVRINRHQFANQIAGI